MTVRRVLNGAAVVALSAVIASATAAVILAAVLAEVDPWHTLHPDPYPSSDF